MSEGIKPAGEPIPADRQVHEALNRLAEAFYNNGQSFAFVVSFNSQRPSQLLITEHPLLKQHRVVRYDLVSNAAEIFTMMKREMES